MKIVYAGTPDFAVAPLHAIINAGHEVVAVITQEDKPVGRKGIITPPPVKAFAVEQGIPVFQPKKIREEVSKVKALGGELMVTCAFGQILSQEVLDCFEKGVWNIHASLLPKYRGASPIQWSVINGDTHTGITLMKTETGLDTGDILLVKRTEILENETAGELSARLSALGAVAITEGLELIEKGNVQLLLQDESQATVVKKITKEQAKINWNTSGKEIVNLIHGMNPAPVAYTLSDQKPVNLYRAAFMEYSGEEPCGTVLNLPKKLAVKCIDGAVI
ncbi:MAG: methionyl-tRNA formyltransferase [Clostridia bacterium]|nr:methionyl-tRNA formyltransferase [Clostridia bacterium]